MKHEDYEWIKSLGGRKALYHLEVERMFNIFSSLENFSPGCTTCPDNARFVIERVYDAHYYPYQQYLDNLHILSANTQTQQIEQPKPKKKK